MPHPVFIDVPPDFSFRATAYSHGWCDLKPFELDTENWRLNYVFSGPSGKAVSAVMSDENGRIKIELGSGKYDIDKIVKDARHILRLDENFAAFYDAISGHERLSWVGKRLAGRLLRSATVYEDLVKTICTTNCSWGLTKSMVANLVDKLGTSSEDGRRAFPTAEQMAAVPVEFYRDEVRAGYRSQYFVELAESVAGGTLNPESWLHSELSTADLKKEMKKVKGVGDYAAENLLKLVGRYDGLALDSWLRSQFYKNHNDNVACPDKQIEAHYEPFGKWRGLAIWCDMTEKWIT